MTKSKLINVFMAGFLVWNCSLLCKPSPGSLWLTDWPWLIGQLKLNRVMSNSCTVWSAVFRHTCSQEVGLIHTQHSTFLTKIAQACIWTLQTLTCSLLFGVTILKCLWFLCLERILRPLLLKLLETFPLQDQNSKPDIIF